MLCNQNLWLSSLIFGWRRGPVRGFGDSTSISSGGTCPCRAATWCSSDIYSARFFPSTLVPESCGLDGSLATTPRPLFAFQTFRNACRLRKLPNRSHLLFSYYVVSDFLQLHQLQHPRLPCPSLSPGVCSDSSPLSLWMPSNHLILCCPLLLPSIFSSIRVFTKESVLCLQLAEVLELQLQHQSFQWILRVDFL